MDYTPFCKTEIAFLKQNEILPRLLGLSLANTVLVLSESAAGRWNMKQMIKSIEEESDHFTWLQAIDANPTQGSIVRGLKQIGNTPVDAVVAIGGGSAIDLAKGIAAFHTPLDNSSYTEATITQALEEKKYPNPAPPAIVALPTTAGTGSELTQWATIWDERMAKKYSIDSPTILPQYAFIVPELTLSLPAGITLSTGLDAMCQATEAYWSKHTTPLVQELALRAIVLVQNNLRRAIVSPNDLASRDRMCRASVLAGLAFAQTRTTACHSISYPLTMGFGVPHGLAAAITLEPVGKFNAGAFSGDKELFSLFAPWRGIGPWIDQVSQGVTRLRLSAFGIKEEDLSRIAAKAFTLGRMDNNPVPLDEGQVLEILRSVF